MKYLDGNEVLKGDAVIIPTGEQEVFVVGQVHQFIERSGHIRVTGYALPVKAETAVLASKAYACYVDGIKADKPAPEPPPETPPADQPPAELPPEPTPAA